MTTRSAPSWLVDLNIWSEGKGESGSAISVCVRCDGNVEKRAGMNDTNVLSF